jgi:hypothetical protein
MGLAGSSFAGQEKDRKRTAVGGLEAVFLEQSAKADQLFGTEGGASDRGGHGSHGQPALGLPTIPVATFDLTPLPAAHIAWLPDRVRIFTVQPQELTRLQPSALGLATIRPPAIALTTLDLGLGPPPTEGYGESFKWGSSKHFSYSTCLDQARPYFTRAASRFRPLGTPKAYPPPSLIPTG